MDICICNTELMYLQRHWNELMDTQRAEVLENCYDCNCIHEAALDDLTIKCDTPHIESFSIPDIKLSLDVMEKMTPEEQKALETHVGMPLCTLRKQLDNSTAMFYVTSNYLARHFTLNLPPLELFIIPDRYEIPMSIRKKGRTHLRRLNSIRPNSV